MRPPGVSSSITQPSVDCACKAAAPRPQISTTSNAQGAPVGSSSDLAVMIPSSASSDPARNGENPRQDRANPLCGLLRRPTRNGGGCDPYRDLVLAELAHSCQYIPQDGAHKLAAADER